jgi:cytochrome c5
MPTIRRTVGVARALTLILSAGLLMDCSKSNPAESTPPSAEVKPTPAPAPNTKAAPAATLATLFPDGPGKELLLNTCGACHPVVCTALGQRTNTRWESLKKDHKDKLTSLPSADLDRIFTYLETNFNDAKPEPKIPSEFLQQGCTPF